MADHLNRPDEGDDVSESAVPTHRRPSKKVLTLALVPIVTIIVLGNAAMLFQFYLTDKHPLAMMIVNPTTKHMLLVEAKLDTLSYYASVIIRPLVADPSYYLLGFWYGHTAIAYIKRYSKDIGQFVVQLEGWFPRIGWLLMVVFPHPLVMVLAGASVMRFWQFLLFDTIGVVIRAVLVREFGWIVERQVQWLNNFNHKWWIPLTVVGGALLLWQLWSARNEGPPTPERIRRELEEQEQHGPEHREQKHERSDYGWDGDDDWDGDPLDRPRPRPR